jgi:Animal haem peroxidase
MRFIPRTEPLQPSVAVLLVDAPAAILPLEFRSIDRFGNNIANPTLGAANNPFLRNTISNLIVAQPTPIPNVRAVTDYLWQWGQFIDHDMSLTPFGIPTKTFNIIVPAGGPQFDPGGTGTKVLAFKQSAFANDVNGVRQQTSLTSYNQVRIDYGLTPLKKVLLNHEQLYSAGRTRVRLRDGRRYRYLGWNAGRKAHENLALQRHDLRHRERSISAIARWRPILV